MLLSLKISGESFQISTTLRAARVSMFLTGFETSAGILRACKIWLVQVSAALAQAGELFMQTYDRIFPAPDPRQP